MWLVYLVALLQGLLFGTWLGFMLDKWVRCKAVEHVVQIMKSRACGKRVIYHEETS